jgi:hypothetical protein
LPLKFSVNKLPRKKRFTNELSHSVLAVPAAFQQVKSGIVLEPAGSSKLITVHIPPSPVCRLLFTDPRHLHLDTCTLTPAVVTFLPTPA